VEYVPSELGFKIDNISVKNATHSTLLLCTPVKGTTVTNKVHLYEMFICNHTCFGLIAVLGGNILQEGSQDQYILS
jgi:hypothetical protein